MEEDAFDGGADFVAMGTASLAIAADLGASPPSRFFGTGGRVSPSCVLGALLVVLHGRVFGTHVPSLLDDAHGGPCPWLLGAYAILFFFSKSFSCSPFVAFSSPVP